MNKKERIYATFVTGGELCENDLAKLEQWTPDPNLNLKMVKNLSLQGYKDFFFLGQRLKNAFPSILKNDLEEVNPGDFVVKYL